MIAGWDDDKVKKGKTTLINSLIGIFIVLIAYTLVGWIFTEANVVTTNGQ
jgi:TM2 domain-containing membrane protein YozV